MFPLITHTLQVIMTNLKDVRRVSDVSLIGNHAVRIKIGTTLFDIRGSYPMFVVHEIEGGCMRGSDAAREIEKQLNGEPIIEVEDFDAHDPEVGDALCDHVDSMRVQDVQNYSESCGGPDLDPIDRQRTWLKAHFLHKANNLPELLEEVLSIEGKERKNQLRKVLIK